MNASERISRHPLLQARRFDGDGGALVAAQKQPPRPLLMPQIMSQNRAQELLLQNRAQELLRRRKVQRRLKRLLLPHPPLRPKSLRLLSLQVLL